MVSVHFPEGIMVSVHFPGSKNELTPISSSGFTPEQFTGKMN
jgi:hypothetical protein